MKYRLIGETVPAVEMTLNAGETVYTQKGGMIWQSEDVEMQTSTNGGIMKGLGRMFAGESMFMNNYQAKRDNATIAFGSTVPGKIVPVTFDRTSPGIIAQKGAFLCAEKGVNFNVTFTKRFGAGLFGGEGFILQEITGEGTAFLEVDGDMVEKELQPGETILVDTGNVVAFEKTCKYEVTTVKGAKNIFFGGEGLFLTKLVGPGKIILQTQNFFDFASKVAQLFPKGN